MLALANIMTDRVFVAVRICIIVLQIHACTHTHTSNFDGSFRSDIMARFDVVKRDKHRFIHMLLKFRFPVKYCPILSI